MREGDKMGWEGTVFGVCKGVGPHACTAAPLQPTSPLHTHTYAPARRSSARSRRRRRTARRPPRAPPRPRRAPTRARRGGGRGKGRGTAARAPRAPSRRRRAPRTCRGFELGVLWRQCDVRVCVWGSVWGVAGVTGGVFKLVQSSASAHRHKTTSTTCATHRPAAAAPAPCTHIHAVPHLIAIAAVVVPW